jgi:tetratricopeptide (TPR) repeat protein
MQNALYLFEAMKAAGVAVRPGGAPNEAQFPAQTLAYKSGTVCDAALLYCASLEAAGIPAAFIPLKNDFVACANLGVDQAAAETLFAGTDALLIIDGEVWLPVSAAKLESGFSEAWKAAAQALAAHFASGADAEFIKIEESWAAYPPAPFPALGVRPAKIDASFLAKNADGAVDAYIASDIAAVLRDVQAQAARTPTAALLNRLGIVQVRAGRLNDAKASFERAAGMGSAAAIRNRANIALTEGNEEEAARWLARLGD